MAYASKGVPGVTVRLVEPWIGTHWGVPSGPESVSGADGSFSFKDVATTEEYVLIVFHPFKKGSLVLARVHPAPNIIQEVGTINLLKKLSFFSPQEHAYLRAERVLVKWSSLPEATNYTLKIYRPHSLDTFKAVETNTAQAELDLPVGGYYGLDLYAYDSQGALIGAWGEQMQWGLTIVYHWFGVADPVVESQMEAIEQNLTCGLAGNDPAVYIKPTEQHDRSSSDRLPFLFRRDDKVRLIGKLREWRKVSMVSGYFPGLVGWAYDAELLCK